MPDRPESTSPPQPWNEANSIRETTILYLDDPEHKEAVRAFGRVIYDLAVESTSMPWDETVSKAELRAAAADLRFIQDYLDDLARTEEHSIPAPGEHVYIEFAGYLAGKVADLVKSIEDQL